MRVLLTNDDGIEAAGLQALRRALLELPGIELAVIAPDGNRSAMARSITTRRPLWVQEVDFGAAAGFTSRLIAELESVPLPQGTLLNINVPGSDPEGVEVTRLGKRVYRDELALEDEVAGGRRLYRIYGDASYERDETGTDLAAVARGSIAVTPIHFDLTDREGLTALQRYDLGRLIAPAASELER